MSKKVSLSKILLGIVIFLTIIFAYHQKVNSIEKRIDNLFIECLINAREGFCKDYNHMNYEQKEYQYIKTASDLKTAKDLVLMTTFNKHNKHLVTSLNYLYLCMTDSSSRKLILDQEEKIFQDLIEICENPINIKKSMELEEMAGDIYFNKRKIK